MKAAVKPINLNSMLPQMQMAIVVSSKHPTALTL